MPPWKAGTADVGYLRNPSLTDAQKAAIHEWATHGTPEGDPQKVGPGLARVDATIQVPAPYTPQLKPDDYRCFPLKWNQTEPLYVTGVNAVPGVAAEVHHIAVYLVPPDSADLPFQWDAEDATPGYTCFGGPFGSHPQEFAVGLLTAWIPGYQGTVFPRGGGILVPPGATVVLQMHYNVPSSGPQPDQTKMEFQLEKSVDRVMAYQPYLDPGWVAGAMKIPAGAPSTSFTVDGDPRDFFHLLGSPLTLDHGFNIEAIMFHMHKLGAQGQVYLEKADGSHQKLLDIPAWDFHWQFEYQLAAPVKFEPGDKLRSRCTFDNSPGRLGVDTATREVNWGEGSDDEMCVANILSSQVP
jgi:hypothetical protein